MHLEDTTRFCPKEERESEQTSFSDQNPRQDQKGGFRSSFRKLFKKKRLKYICVFKSHEAVALSMIFFIIWHLRQNRAIVRITSQVDQARSR
ncbi:rho guanine nucleotide exchange factor 33-like isoform X2 [Fukomys damarensis]|uniref:rho guanine nucleotide exchange factor 33-like isoform X2 n=1 Tax=Fukomys damarensis TaxID=885580 RepID=UPI0014557DC3|nr:rho guanine nucleotide exchange factor 33-like isoform X2 [Fukomys damarensis]